MRVIHAAPAAAGVLACLAAPASAKHKPDTPPDPPAGAIGNVDFVGNLPDMKWATAINFLEYRQGARRGRDLPARVLVS